MVEAYAWFSVAATNGYDTAANSRDSISKSLSLSDLEQAQELAKNYYAQYKAVPH